jgi:hypothetical protein
MGVYGCSPTDSVVTATRDAHSKPPFPCGLGVKESGGSIGAVGVTASEWALSLWISRLAVPDGEAIDWVITNRFFAILNPNALHDWT